MPSEENPSPTSLGQNETSAHSRISAVERSMLVIEQLTASRSGLSVTLLSSRLGINKALIHRILASLSARGYVYKDEESENYHLSTKFLGLAFKHLQVLDIYDIMLPILRRLARETGELAELNWLSNGRLVTVAKADSPRRVKVVDYLGEEQILHATASGKVWLASLPEEEALRIVLERGLYPISDNTITKITDFQRELERVREQGYALNIQESGWEAASIAAPVRPGPDHEVVGAVSVVAPAHRRIYEDERAIRLCIEAADEISDAWPFVTLER